MGGTERMRRGGRNMSQERNALIHGLYTSAREGALASQASTVLQEDVLPDSRNQYVLSAQGKRQPERCL